MPSKYEIQVENKRNANTHRFLSLHTSILNVILVYISGCLFNDTLSTIEIVRHFSGLQEEANFNLYGH
jgi:hypothetical protein